MPRPRGAEQLGREIAALDRLGLGLWEYADAAIDVVRRGVPFDATCWATVDPDSLLLTGQATVSFDPSPELEARFVEIEYGGRDPHPFAELAERDRPAVRLSDAGRARLARSERLADVYGPLGVRHEARVAFVADRRCWGVAGLLRGGGSDFTDAEVATLASLSPLLARGLRAAATRSAADGAAGDAGPAVVVLSPDGQVRSATAAALDRLQALDPRPGHLAFALRTLLAGLHLGDQAARARVRDGDGSWVVLRAAWLGRAPAAGDRDVVVTIEPTGRADLVDLVLAAHGLTRREQELSREVLAGRSTKEIAAALHLSPHTVQDHLKSIFDKLGVRSRRELVAALDRGTGR